MNKSDLLLRQKIFMPYASSRMAAAKECNQKFIHYTTAESAVKILQSQKIWMRNVRCMSDYSEVDYGSRILDAAIKKHAKSFMETLDKCHPGVYAIVINNFRIRLPHILHDTYICSLSEHGTHEVDGRLSMWNTFGKASATAALVLNINLEESDKEGAGIIFSPVGYFDENQTEEQLLRIIKNINENQDYLRSISAGEVANMLTATFVTAVTCIKHPGFREENEWRALHIPTIIPSAFVKPEIQYISGIPQIVAMLPLKNDQKLGITGLSLNDLIYKVIVGPSPFSTVIYGAVAMALKNAGVKDMESKIITSGIPIRT